MSRVQTLKINGLDSYDTYGFMVLQIEPYSPLADVRHQYNNRHYMGSEYSPGKITLKGYVSGTSNEDMQENLELLAGAIGYYGGEYRECSIQVIYTDSDGVAGESAILKVRLSSFKTRDFSKRNRARNSVAELDLDFDVVGYINPDGLTVKSYSDVDDLYHLYFEDTDALQGADNLKFMWHIITAGTFGNYYFMVESLAVKAGFEVSESSAETGTRDMTLGQFGNPALNFALAGDNTYRETSGIQLFPIVSSEEITVMVRFKWSGTANGSTKTLFEASTGGKFRISINTTSRTASFLHGTNTVTINSTDAFSSTDWNTIIVRCQSGASGQKIWLKIPGVDEQSETDTSQGSQYDSSVSFYIGTEPGGSERCDCAISEVVIWKYPLSDNAISEALSRAMPIKDSANFELNKRITYYQNFNYIYNDTIYYLCNPLTRFQLEASYSDEFNDGDIVILDVDKRKALQISAVGDTTNLIEYIETYERFDPWPVIERYNKFLLWGIAGGGLGGAETDMQISYNAKRRM